MTLTFFFQIVFFWRHAFRHQNLHLWNATVASLEHNCHIFGTKLPHLWNTTVTPMERNVLAVWRGVWLQHYDRSNYNTVTVLIF